MKIRADVVVILVVALCCAGCLAKYEKVHMSQVTGLTFYKDRMTTGRRTSPMPQLQCVKGDACADFTPSVVQCTRTGWDGYEAQWKCEAELPQGMSLGSTTVNCEGYSGPDDDNILRGSCGLEYELRWTGGRPANYRNPDYTSHSNWGSNQQQQNQQNQQHEGLWSRIFGRRLQEYRDKYQHPAQSDSWFYGKQTSSAYSKPNDSWGWGSWIMFGLILYIVWHILKALAKGPATTHAQQPQYHFQRPAYQQQPPQPQVPRNDAPYPNNYDADTGRGWAKYETRQATQPVYAEVPVQQPQQQGRGGFWSGAGLGSLAGYALGRLGRRNNVPAATEYYGPPPSAPPVTNIYGTPATSYPPGYNTATYSSGGSSASYASNPEPPPAQQASKTHTSTGYGTTKRR